MARFTQIAFLLILPVLFACCPNQSFTEIERTTIDTAVIDIKFDTIYFEAEPEIIYRQDTLILTPPFSALIDTVIEKDTVRIRYAFPENSATVTVREHADTVYSQIKTIKKTEVIREETSYFEFGGYAIAGLILGALIMFFKNKFGNKNACVVVQNCK